MPFEPGMTIERRVSKRRLPSGPPNPGALRRARISRVRPLAPGGPPLSNSAVRRRTRALPRTRGGRGTLAGSAVARATRRGLAGIHRSNSTVGLRKVRAQTRVPAATLRRRSRADHRRSAPQRPSGRSGAGPRNPIGGWASQSHWRRGPAVPEERRHGRSGQCARI